MKIDYKYRESEKTAEEVKPGDPFLHGGLLCLRTTKDSGMHRGIEAVKLSSGEIVSLPGTEKVTVVKAKIVVGE